MLKATPLNIADMHKATIAALVLGALGLAASAGSIYFGFESEMEFAREQGRSEQYGEEIWTGNTPTRFEGELSFTSLYPVFIQETRDADVTLVGGDEQNRFVPCDSGDDPFGCDIYFQEGGVDYRLLGMIWIGDSGDWEVIFSGDVTGDSKVMIREMLTMSNGVQFVGLGCLGSVFSCLALLVGIIFAFTLKGNKAPSEQVVYAPGSFDLEGQHDGPTNIN